MSQWTYVQGCLYLSLEPYELKPIKVPQVRRPEDPEKEPEQYKAWLKWRRAYLKSAYLPYPEEQFKINVPTMLTRCCKKSKKHPEGKETVLHTHVKIYSLPRARKYLDEAFAMLPQGECGFNYAVRQGIGDSYSGCSDFDFNCYYKYFKNAIDKLYYNDDYFYCYTFEDLVKYQGLDKSCWVDNVDGMTIGIYNPLRWSSAKEVQEGFEKCIEYLLDKGFDICSGYLEWTDNFEYNNPLRHTLRVDGKFDGYRFETFEINTNKLVYRKIFKVPEDENGLCDFDKLEKDGYVITEEYFE